MLRVLA